MSHVSHGRVCVQTANLYELLHISAAVSAAQEVFGAARTRRCLSYVRLKQQGAEQQQQFGQQFSAPLPEQSSSAEQSASFQQSGGFQQSLP